MATTTPSTAPASRARRRARRAATWATRALAAVGALALALLTLGVVADVRAVDRTRGGYEPPYTGWTGTPIDWTDGLTTQDGFYRPGYVVDAAVDCTTGMISFTAFGVTRDYRVLSPRAIAVHEPREACTAAGFSPRF